MGESQTPVRVLVAESDALVVDAIRWMLEQIGYTIVGEAADGLEMIEMTKRLRPDVILMDLRLHELEGLEAARRIQQECPTPIVVLTEQEKVEVVQQASMCGIGAYLIKPPHVRELEGAIIIAMGRFADLMELRRLNEELDAYAHTVAHDLKAPLGIIIPLAELLAGQASVSLPPEVGRKHARRILEYAYKMQEIVESLLLLAEARVRQVPLYPLDMGQVVAGALKRLAWTVQHYQVEIVHPQRWPTALGYAPWVEGVWANYLSNAIKYGGRPPRLELGGEVMPDGMVRFWVRDNGPGISETLRDRLFVPFSRAPDGQIEGHGLGLSIARRIVERLGGEVGVESVEGEGSTFSFTLPGVTTRR